MCLICTHQHTVPVKGCISLPLSFSTALSEARLPFKMEIWRPAGARGEDRGYTTSWTMTEVGDGEREKNRGEGGRGGKREEVENGKEYKDRKMREG